MYYFVVLLLLIQPLLAVDCTSSEDYVKIYRVTTTWASEESFQIKNGASVLLTSPVYANSETRTTEHCVQRTTNSQYSLELTDTYGDYWSAGSHVTFFGIRGNSFFKGYLHATKLDVYPLSLYYPINTNAVWKFKNGVSDSDWMTYGYSDSSWTEVTFGNSGSVSSTGAQYFRKQFTGMASMSSYELQIKFQYGCLVYVNGVEVLRDNLPSGPISSSTVSSGSYSSESNHGVLRNGNDIAGTNSVIAYELHFSTTSSTASITTNAFLAFYTKSLPETDAPNCRQIPYAPSFMTIGGTTPENLWDWNYNTYWYQGTAVGAWNMYYWGNDITPQVNGFFWNSGGYASYQLKSLTLSGSYTQTTSGQFYNLHTFLPSYLANYAYYYGTYDFQTPSYKAYKMMVNAATYSYFYFTEMQLMVCNRAVPTSFTYTTLNIKRNVEMVNAIPSVGGVSSCSCDNLPEGLVLNSVTCFITGSAKVVGSGEYIIRATSPISINGTIIINVTDCTDTIIELARVYGPAITQYETVIIRDASNESNILYNEAANSGQLTSATATYRFCTTAAKVKITLGTSQQYWYYGSFAVIRTILNENVYENCFAARYDNYLATGTEFFVTVLPVLKTNSTWYYKHAYTSSDWHSADTSSWSSSTRGQFPSSSNKYQVYRRTFDVTSLDYTKESAFTLAIQYQYGVIVYMNGNEVYRNNLSAGELNTASVTGSFTSLTYRFITLPLVSLKVDSVDSKQYIKSGTNTIAIACVALSDTQTSSTFDGYVRLFGDSSVSRGYDYTGTFSAMSGNPTYVFQRTYIYTLSSAACSANWLQLKFNDERREWLSSIVLINTYNTLVDDLRKVVVEAMNPSDSTWTVLATVEGMRWWINAQKKRLYLPNNKPYNMYRLRDMATGEPDRCKWQLSSIDIVSESTDSPSSSFSYASGTIEMFRFIEAPEVYPSTFTYLHSFSISPALPAGLYIDPPTGILCGTPGSQMATTSFTVTGKKMNGDSITSAVSLKVDICTGTRSLITAALRTESYYSVSQFHIYEGRGTSGTVIHQTLKFPYANTFYYVDSCLDHKVYTVRYYCPYTNGWVWPGSGTLSVDEMSMVLDLAYIRSATTSPTTYTYSFSSHLPFQIDYTTWKVFSTAAQAPADWTKASFDDSSWTSTTAANIGEVSFVTTYIRSSFTLSTIEYYSVLNVRVRYMGGIVSYFNGKMVAKFNLVDNFDYNTESIGIHEPNSFSMFHIILTTTGVVVGSNVVAFEVHRPKGGSSAQAVIFDATGVFGVNNECNIVNDSYMELSQSWTIGPTDSLMWFFDKNPTTYMPWPATMNSKVTFAFQNTHRPQFNSMYITCQNTVGTLSYTLNVRTDTKTQIYHEVMKVSDYTLLDRGFNRFQAPIGMAGLRYYELELVTPPASNTIILSEIAFEYCVVAGATMCPAVGDYPAVNDQQISPGPCAYGFTGYSFRTCSGTVLSEIDLSKCTYIPPENLEYSQKEFKFVVGIAVNIAKPTLDYLAQSFSLEDGVLPAGLILNEVDGSITGIPSEPVATKQYKVFAKNEAGSTFATLDLSVKIGECLKDGDWPRVEVGKTITLDCGVMGSYIGTMSRYCKLGTRDGEWQPVDQMCMSFLILILLVVVGVLLLVVVIVLLNKVIQGKKKKNAAGVKKSAKSPAKKASNAKAPVKV